MQYRSRRSVYTAGGLPAVTKRERRRHKHLEKTRKARLLPARPNAQNISKPHHERSLAAGRRFTTYLRWITRGYGRSNRYAGY